MEIHGHKKTLSENRSVFLGKENDTNFIIFERSADNDELRLQKTRNLSILEKDGKHLTRLKLSDEALKTLVELYHNPDQTMKHTVKINEGLTWRIAVKEIDKD